MRVIATSVSKGSNGSALPETSLEFESGRAQLTAVETAQRPTVLSLIVSGRMKPATGTVTIDGTANAKELRKRIAIVDAPDISEPHSDVRLGSVVAEELMFAGRVPAPWNVRQWLDEHGMRAHSRVQMGELDPGIRVRALAELALLRGEVEGLVIVSPDRHGGDPREWWGTAEELAARGVAVLVVAGYASSQLLGTTVALHEDAAPLVTDAAGSAVLLGGREDEVEASK